MTEDTEASPMGQPRRRVIDLNQYARQDDPMPQQGRPQPVSAAVEAFRDAMAAAGLGRPEIVPDGKLHRFDTPDEPTAKRKGSGWYIFYHDNIPSGAFGSWAHDISETWSSRANYEMSGVEIEAVRERWRQAREVREATRLQLAAEAARIAAEMWAETPDAASTHPYLARKQVGAFGVKAKPGGALLVAMWSAQGSIIGLQRIFPDGTKRYLTGVAKEGAFGWIEGDQGTVYIAEGYATAASVHMATGHGVAIAFDAGNLEPVAKAVKEVFPQAKLILAADNDRWTKKQDGTPWNVGIEKAQRAAHAAGASVVWPDFRDLSTKPTDFNDLHVLEGIDAVRAQARGYSVRLTDWRMDSLNDKPAPPITWLVEDTIPRGAVIVLAAVGGVGKSMLTLDLALRVAGEPVQGIDLSGTMCSLGHKIAGHGPVVMLAAEDSRDELHRRAFALGLTFPARFYCVTMAELEQPLALVQQGQRGVEGTPFWREVVDQCLTLRPWLIIVDPMSCFVQGDANDPAVGAYSMGLFQGLATKTGAAVILVHHMSKMRDGISSPDAARAAIRGSTALVDHARGAYALWNEKEDKAKKTCEALGEDYKRGKVVKGCLVKHNFRGDDEVTDFVRQENGLLVSASDRIRYQQSIQWPKILDALEIAIAEAAKQGHPFQHTGRHGLFELRERLPEILRTLGEKSLRRAGRELLDSGRVGKYRPAKGGKSEVWLDVPTGDFALGIGELAVGQLIMVDNPVGKTSVPTVANGANENEN